MAGGIRDGHELKFWTPGGSSTPLLHRRAPRRPAGLRVGRRRRARCSAPARCRSSTRRPRRAGRARAGPSSTRTSPAASARRAARAPTGWCRSCERLEHGQGTAGRPRQAARHLRQHPGPRRSARSVTARPARSPSAIKYFRDEYVAALHTAGGCPFAAGASTLFAQPRRCPHDRHHRPPPRCNAGDRRPRRRRPDAGHPDHRRRRGQRAQGHAGHPGRRADRHPDPAVLRPPAARAGRRLPPVPGRGRDPGPDGQLRPMPKPQASCTIDGHRGHGGQDPAHLAGRPTRRSRA